MKYLRAMPLLALFAISLIPMAVGSTANAPIVRSSQGLSLNWSGYAVSAQDVTSVTGTFNVPTVSGPGGTKGLPTDVSVWLGIDGYTSGTVEQTGVSGSFDTSTNAASYYAWWEMYPRSSSTIRTMSVSPGDSITASVVYNGGGSFTLSISDTTDGQSFTTTVHAPVGGRDVAQRSSAEWVVERAATIYKGYLTILPLATFDSATFADASFAVGTAAPVTLQFAVGHYPQYSGYPATPPSQPYWEQMIMAGYSGGNLINLDTVSTVTSNSFSVGFLANGDPYPIAGIFRQK